MVGICLKNGVYVLIDNDEENDSCIYHPELKGLVTLLGGRVKINAKVDYSYDSENAFLTIDGISIIRLEDKSKYEYLPISTIASHLNAIEANGVDAFLVNYKKSIEFLYGELKEIHHKTESQLTAENDDSKLKNLLFELDSIKNLLISVLALLFNLHTYLTAGLENEKVISTCQSIIDSLS